MNLNPSNQSQKMSVADDQELLSNLGGDTSEHPLPQTLHGGFLQSEVEAAEGLLRLNHNFMPEETEE